MAYPQFPPSPTIEIPFEQAVRWAERTSHVHLTCIALPNKRVDDNWHAMAQISQDVVFLLMEEAWLQPSPALHNKYNKTELCSN
jgi:hypothetical protein